MEVVIEMDLLVEEQAMLVEYFEVDGQLASEDIVDMFEDTANMVEDTVDMVEDMVDMILNIAKMVSIVVVISLLLPRHGNIPRIVNIHLILYRKLQVLISKHTWR